jgi:uncharacterized protein (UPF0333 family)
LNKKFLNKKGQISFETLFIALIVLSSAIFISSLYLQIHDVTLATVIVRNNLTHQLNYLETPSRLVSVNIISITLPQEEGVTAQILIQTNPINLEITDFNSIKLEQLKEKIIQNTKFSSVEFKINN